MAVFSQLSTQVATCWHFVVSDTEGNAKSIWCKTCGVAFTASALSLSLSLLWDPQKFAPPLGLFGCARICDNWLDLETKLAWCGWETSWCCSSLHLLCSLPWDNLFLGCFINKIWPDPTLWEVLGLDLRGKVCLTLSYYGLQNPPCKVHFHKTVWVDFVFKYVSRPRRLSAVITANRARDVGYAHFNRATPRCRVMWVIVESHSLWPEKAPTKHQHMTLLGRPEFFQP